jgi:peptidylprolyl isomerase
LRRALACLALALSLTACKDDAKPRAQLSQSTSPTPRPIIPTTKPKITVPKGAPPKTLVKTELIPGTGDIALPGQVVSVNYVGVFYSDGTEFDSSWDDGHPLQFQLGGEQVIPGWDEGVVGMRVGGRRELVIPPDLAYGPEGGQGIPPNSTLVFVVDLVDVSGRVGVVPANPSP